MHSFAHFCRHSQHAIIKPSSKHLLVTLLIDSHDIVNKQTITNLNCWNVDLTVFELTVYFNPEKIGKNDILDIDITKRHRIDIK